MKNYSAWPTERLQEEEKDLRLDGDDEYPDICKADKSDNLQMIRRMREGHAEWLAVCSELQTRKNRET